MSTFEEYGAFKNPTPHLCFQITCVILSQFSYTTAANVLSISGLAQAWHLCIPFIR